MEGGADSPIRTMNTMHGGKHGAPREPIFRGSFDLPTPLGIVERRDKSPWAGRMSIVAAIVTRFWRRRQYFGQTRFPHCSPRRLLIIKVITLMQCGDPLVPVSVSYRDPPPPLEPPYLECYDLESIATTWNRSREIISCSRDVIFRRIFPNGWKIIGLIEETWRNFIMKRNNNESSRKEVLFWKGFLVNLVTAPLKYNIMLCSVRDSKMYRQSFLKLLLTIIRMKSYRMNGKSLEES